MPNIEGLDDYQDIEALMVNSVQPPPKASPLFCPEFPVQSLLTDSQIQEQISHLRELFGNENIDKAERLLSKGKEKNGTQWQLHNDPVLLRKRFALSLTLNGLIDKGSKSILTPLIKKDCQHTQWVKPGKKGSHGHGCASKRKALWLRISQTSWRFGWSQ